MQDVMSLAFLKKMKEKGLMESQDEEGAEVEFTGEEPEYSKDDMEWKMNDEASGKQPVGSYQSGKAGMDMMSEDSIMRILKMRDKDQHG